MTSSINFTSTYSFPPRANSIKKQRKLQGYLNDFNNFQVADNLFMYSNKDKAPETSKDASELLNEIPYYNIRHGFNVVTPEDNKSLEEFCAQKGIFFQKSESQKINLTEVLKKIKPPKNNMMLAYVNAKALEKIADSQFSNIEDCSNDYINNYYERINKMLAGDEEIPATTLCLLPSSSSQEELLTYIAQNGAYALQDRQLITEFDQRTYQPDHCMYFALRNLGMKYIPVYVDGDTYDIGMELGILSNEP